MKKYSILLIFALSSLCVITATMFSTEKVVKENITSIDGYVKFYISLSSTCSRATMGLLPTGISASNVIKVNGETYEIKSEEDGRQYINVKEASDSIYNAVLLNTASSSYFNADGINSVCILHSQFYRKSLNIFKTYPMYARYHQESGNELVFEDGFAVLDIAISGKKEELKSIVIENPLGNAISGTSTYSFEKEALIEKSGVPYIAYNCTNEGTPVSLTANPKHFYIPILASEYSKGLNIRISDLNHKMMEIHVDEQNLKANDVLKIDAKYTPDENLVFYEGFDNFVWGGDYVAGSVKGKRFSVNSTNPGTTANSSLTGYENAIVQVASTTPGTGYIQSNTWSDVNGYNVKKSHVTSDSYLTSRGVMDYKYLFRCQEFSGYVAVGCASTTRGIFQTPNWTELNDLCNITVEFDVAVMASFNDRLDVQICNGGNIEKVYIDGGEVTLNSVNCFYSGIASHFLAPSNYFKYVTSATAAKKWYHVKMEVANANDGTNLLLQGYSSSTGNHGFYVDNIKVCKNSSSPLVRGSVRLLYWNIQNGMWADQESNYNNFVNWVKKYDPDICVWCESRSNYVSNSGTSLSNSSSYLPNKYSSSDTNAGWAELAKRYGHNYAALGGHRDNFPQEITSKYPITTLLKITSTNDSSKPIAHGAAIQQVDVNGTKLNFITLHTWPQKYGYGVASANQEASAAAGEGDKYREYEMDYILKNTYLSDKYKNLTNWIMLGDFNSHSIKDNFFYGYDTNSTKLLCHNVILNNSDLKDVIAEKYPGQFMASTAGSSRIDYVYTSPDIYSLISNAFIVKDNWTSIEYTGISNFYLPSDHRPILVDFNINPTAIPSIQNDKKGTNEEACYDLMGRKTSGKNKGVTIVKYSDGSTRKVLNK